MQSDLLQHRACDRHTYACHDEQPPERKLSVVARAAAKPGADQHSAEDDHGDIRPPRPQPRLRNSREQQHEATEHQRAGSSNDAGGKLGSRPGDRNRGWLRLRRVSLAGRLIWLFAFESLRFEGLLFEGLLDRL